MSEVEEWTEFYLPWRCYLRGKDLQIPFVCFSRDDDFWGVSDS